MIPNQYENAEKFRIYITQVGSKFQRFKRTKDFCEIFLYERAEDMRKDIEKAIGVHGMFLDLFDAEHCKACTCKECYLSDYSENRKGIIFINFESADQGVAIHEIIHFVLHYFKVKYKDSKDAFAELWENQEEMAYLVQSLEQQFHEGFWNSKIFKAKKKLWKMK